ncbi:hypothetical protein [Streptomyces sp. NPDC047453]
MLYHKWPGQNTAQDARHHEVERPARMKTIEERAEALSKLSAWHL